MDPFVHGAVERVEHVGAVQRDRQDRAVAADLHLGHRANDNPRIEGYEAYPSLELDRPAEHVLRLTLRAPGRLNAVSGTMHRELAEIWKTIGSDDETRAVVVRGADGAFSSGGDLELVLEIANDQATRLRVFHEARDLVYNVVNCPKPIVSAMTGPAVGAGLAVGLLADVSIATPNARIVDGHTKLGVAAGDHAVIVWPLLCGLAKAKYHLLLCEPIDGAEAERIGLVSLCVPEDELEERALAIASRLARGSQAAIRHTKLALNNWLRLAGPAFDASLALEFLDMTGPDVHEGVAAVREKREPTF
ncbi:MAG TPA: enoyl-CoA hydratase/isomerase family protein [Gaiellaceae bacterium]|nr:enoyl-CoA hydratase/isomerase family protein [Gaiellaceae bacterium]